MGLTANEQVRREEVEVLAKLLTEERGRIELDTQEMRERILAQFTRRLDAKLKNLQEGEALIVTFDIDIIGKAGKVRGGSGSERNMPEYIEWRDAVFGRDNYTCRECGARGKLNAHHIKGWTGHPELRFDIDNGITLCPDCHGKKHPHIGFFK